MAVRSRRIFGPVAITTAGPTVTYTVPAGRTAVVRTILLVNTATVDNECRILLVNGPLANGRVFNQNVPARTTVEVEDVVFNPGDVVRFTANTTGGSTLNVAMYGSLLLGEPE